MQKKTKRIILLTILLLIILSIIILLIQNTNKQIPQPLTEQAKAQYETIIGNQTYDITEAVLEPTDIAPTVSAGMIPVKWDGTNWIITNREDADWYDYANGQPAYIMLNDGYYRSEIEREVKEEQLMENNVGTIITRPEDLGTIYMWIPRFAYNNQGEILYIKQGHSIAGTYTIPEIFTYETEKRDFSLSGIWVECNPLANNSAVNTKISNMKGQNNQYGFTANTIGINANNETTYQTTIETYINILYTDENTIVGASISRPQLGDISNTNRTILKITNSNQLESIKGKAYYDTDEEKIKIVVIYTTNTIEKILDINGEELSTNSTTADTKDELIGNGIYKFIAIDSEKQQKLIKVTVTGLDVYNISNEEELKLFRDAVNNNKTTAKTIANQVADVYMNEGKYMIDEETGDITFREDADKWTGITSYYYGKYYGNGHTISGIYGNTGLFNSCDGAYIKDLGIVNSYISASSKTGAIVGYARNNTTLENCYSEATIEVKADRVGGLVGATYNSSTAVQLTVNNCYNEGKIIINKASTYIGGIVGYPYNTNISNCYNTGEIAIGSGGSTRYIGGIVGYMSYGYIQNSYNIANVEPGGENVGGIAGNIDSSRSGNIINNCYNVGNISGTQYIGGITGSGVAKYCYNTGSVLGTGQYVGGIGGRLSGKECIELYNCGNVSGTHYVGGISGAASNVKNCYNIGNVLGSNNVAGITSGPTSIQNCYNIGSVNGETHIGGIMAGTDGNSGGTIQNCYNTGDITGNRYVGGIWAYLRDTATISNSYNSGKVEGTNNIGGILGYTYASSSCTISRNYYKTGTALYGNGRGNNTGAEALDEMPTIISVINNENGFIEDDSENPINNGNPILSWQTDNDKLNLINSDNAFVPDLDGINSGYPILAWQAKSIT